MERTILGWSRRVAAASILCAGLVTAAGAADETGGIPGQWLSEYAGARTLGLGGAFVAAADDPLGALWNPAGPTQMDQNQVLFETARVFEGTTTNSIGFAVPGSRLPTIGLSVFSLHSGDFQKTNELNEDLGSFSESEMAFLLNVAHALSPRLALGANLKVARQSLEDYSAGGVGVDLGGLFDITPSVCVGGSILNLGGPSLSLRDTKETYPIELRGGLAAQVFKGRGLLSLQVDALEGPGVRLHAGGQYRIHPSIDLRIGYDDSYAAGGFSYRFRGPLQVDYALADRPLGMTHRLGLSYRFGGFFAASTADPAVFSPTGENAVTKVLLNARTKAEPKSWRLVFLDKSDEVVRSFGGQGQPPAHLLWDGKDEAGLPLPDGIYRYWLVVTDQEGREITGPTRSVEIFTTGPQGSVPVEPVR